MTTEEKIKKLIKTSLFLSDKQKEKLNKIFRKLNEKEKEKLLEILESEKTAISEMIRSYMEKNGDKAVSNLEMILNKGKGKIRRKEEEKDRTKDAEQAEKLLDDLNNL